VWGGACDVDRNQEELAQVMTAECGKPLAESRGEVLFKI
jgi:acyl-CoA reductase-like NAD-dependent aldehyde dehydrogenase